MAQVDMGVDFETVASSVVVMVIAAADVVDVLTLETETPRSTEEQTEEHSDTVEHMSWIYSARERSSLPHGSSSMPPIYC
jgi:hypothetical protein